MMNCKNYVRNINLTIFQMMGLVGAFYVMMVSMMVSISQIIVWIF